MNQTETSGSHESNNLWHLTLIDRTGESDALRIVFSSETSPEFTSLLCVSVLSVWTGRRSAGRRGFEPCRDWRRSRGKSGSRRRNTWRGEPGRKRRRRRRQQERRKETRRGVKAAMAAGTLTTTTQRECKHNNFLSLYLSWSPLWRESSCCVAFWEM